MSLQGIKPAWQAALGIFGSTVNYESYSTIAGGFETSGRHAFADPQYSAAFQAMSDKRSSYAFVPLQNSLHGGVIETLDLLRSPNMGLDVLIRGFWRVPISHSLVVHSGTTMGEITSVYSHEQVGALSPEHGVIERY